MAPPPLHIVPPLGQRIARQTTQNEDIAFTSKYSTEPVNYYENYQYYQVIKIFRDFQLLKKAEIKGQKENKI